MDEKSRQQMALKAAKKELRSFMKSQLANISKESIDSQSTKIFNNILKFKPYQDAGRVGIYLSMPNGEVQTESMVRHALSEGKQVFVPYIHAWKERPPDSPRKVMDMVRLLSLSDYESLERDSWGIPTIGEDTLEQREMILEGNRNNLDLILMPGVAFDLMPEDGAVRRIGHGRGFYDLFINRYRALVESKRSDSKGAIVDEVLLYGLALEEQYLPSAAERSVPVAEHDNTLHGLFVGDGGLLERPSRRR